MESLRRNSPGGRRVVESYWCQIRSARWVDLKSGSRRRRRNWSSSKAAPTALSVASRALSCLWCCFQSRACFSSASWKSRGSALSRVPEPRVSSLDFRVGRAGVFQASVMSVYASPSEAIVVAIREC